VVELQTMDWPSYVATISTPAERNTTQLHFLGWAPPFLDASQQALQFLSAYAPPGVLPTSFDAESSARWRLSSAGRRDQPCRTSTRARSSSSEDARRGVRREELEGLLGGVEEGAPSREKWSWCVPLGRGSRWSRRTTASPSFEVRPRARPRGGSRRSPARPPCPGRSARWGGGAGASSRRDPRLREERLRLVGSCA